MKKAAFMLYTWGSTILFGLIIYWLATVPNLDAGNEVNDELVKVVFRMTIYAVFFILFYRSIILTLKNSVVRLSSWRSKREKIEDAEFVLIIETLVVIISILGTTLFSVFEEFVQSNIDGRTSDAKDVLVSLMAVLLSAIVVYSMPVIGELEMAIKHRFDEVFSKKEKESEK